MFTRVKNGINELWQDAKVRMFGSTAQDTFLPQSDIDVMIQVYNNGITEETMWWALMEHLKTQEWAVTPTFIPAKVKIVRLTDKQTGIGIDISINKIDGLKAVAVM